MSTPSSQTTTTDNGKTIALLSYITWIGWIIALIMHNGNKTKLGAFHLRQTLGLWIFGIVACVAVVILQIVLAFIPGIGLILAMIVSAVFGLGMLYLWIMGLLSALKAEEKPMPIIGEKIQSMLKGVFTV